MKSLRITAIDRIIIRGLATAMAFAILSHLMIELVSLSGALTPRRLIAALMLAALATTGAAFLWSRLRRRR